MKKLLRKRKFFHWHSCMNNNDYSVPNAIGVIYNVSGIIVNINRSVEDITNRMKYPGQGAASKKMNILHLSTYLHAGAGKIIHDLAIAQKLLGHHVTIAINGTEYTGYNSYPEYIENLSGQGIDVVKTDSMFKRDLPLNLNSAACIHNILAERDIDLVHAHAAIPSFVALTARNGLRRRIPVIQTMHGWGLNKTAEHEAMDVTILNFIDRVIAVSEHDKKLLREKGVYNDISVIYNGIFDNPEKNRSTYAQYGKDGEIIVGCIGTIGSRKNQRILLEAASHINNDIHFVLIGEDPDGLITGREKEYGNITYLGRIPDAFRFIPGFDYMILPSRSEGFPLAVIEAFMSSTPVIASDIPPLMEAVEDGATGFVFKSDNLADLIRVLGKAAQARRSSERSYQDLRLNCRRAYEERFTFDKMLFDYQEVYKRI